MTATIFFSIFFSLFIFHLQRPFPESMVSTEVGASSSSSNLSNIKQRLVNSIKDLLDLNIEHNNSDLVNNKQQPQLDNIMSMPPTMVPTSAGSSTTSVLPQHQQVIFNEDNTIRQLNNITIALKIRDNNLYQTASTSLLNYYDNFSSIFYLANSTPINLNIDTPVLKHLDDFINNMQPAQRSMGTTSASEWFICLTEAEHQHYQQHEVLQQRPFEKFQQQKPRLHNDAISALNYFIYIGSATTTTETFLPNTPNDSVLYLYSFILVSIRVNSVVSLSSCRIVVQEPSDNQQQVPPTAAWGYLNSIIMGAPTTILSFIHHGR